MTTLRAALLAAGLALGAYGAVLLADNPLIIIKRILLWALIGVLVHDFVFAPACVALGAVGRRILPGSWRTPVAVASLCTIVLALLAVPVYTKPGIAPDNDTVLDRDYHAGLLIAVAIVWVCVPGYYLLARRLPVRQNQMVEGKSANDIDGQPPTP
ncbi:hypothetical protein FZI85_09385 [Mycobacterium sp. CBMA293]|uniref:hypothetical protein n=1 Tax=unclassified Mycolicibacterium TaxID=2636767 RepID=UPI0012DC6BAA|nr:MULTISPECIES: hypothetical protein [unclassified Mycolicibacterium]MUL46197.1 hypothetical protein [Mycolicibacterium sp. CBMA 360]MUL58753.1 hypothetical protein [Mycolicibacterium sp. CBMA 335]MUL69147.1 hypothetical protein [Mycolicibacterium sp. CBMA 311]MUL94111.1 hypothetical protein [Mycolicibacterium sp. CBMA 230]MUM05123.1 hypothetical protein [Mycolicibacterium sp. CBMA 213]